MEYSFEWCKFWWSEFRCALTFQEKDESIKFQTFEIFWISREDPSLTTCLQNSGKSNHIYYTIVATSHDTWHIYNTILTFLVEMSLCEWFIFSSHQNDLYLLRHLPHWLHHIHYPDSTLITTYLLHYDLLGGISLWKIIHSFVIPEWFVFTASHSTFILHHIPYSLHQISYLLHHIPFSLHHDLLGGISLWRLVRLFVVPEWVSIIVLCFVPVCMYIYMHTYIYTYMYIHNNYIYVYHIYIYIHIYLHIHIHIYVPVCMYVCICKYVIIYLCLFDVSE